MSKRKKKAGGAGSARVAQARLTAAREDLELAERTLKASLSALPLVLRADKKIISDPLRLALDKVAEAKHKLESLLEK